MSKQIKKGSGKEAYFARYKTAKVFETNKRRKLERALKRNPENKQIAEALKNIAFTKKSPKTSAWNPTTIAFVKILKEFKGKFNPDIFNKDPEIATNALKTKNEALFTKVNSKMSKQSFFSVGQRAHDGQGNLVWSI